jgi:hypothetical protein
LAGERTICWLPEKKAFDAEDLCGDEVVAVAAMGVGNHRSCTG